MTKPKSATVDKETALLKGGWVKDHSYNFDANKGQSWKCPMFGDSFYEDGAYEMLVYMNNMPKYMIGVIRDSHERIVSLENQITQLRGLLEIDMRYICGASDHYKLFFTNPKRWYQFWK